MRASESTTEPDVPIGTTVSAYCTGTNDALTIVAPLTVTVQSAVPEQPPPIHPLNM